jgi:hypothetical protein
MGNVNSPEPKGREMKERKDHNHEESMGGSMGRLGKGDLEKGYASEPMSPSTITVGIGWIGG